MKIHYIAHVRLPTEKAHGLQIVKTCEALAKAGSEVELVVPVRRTPIAQDLFSYYGAEGNFKVTKLKSPTLARQTPSAFRFNLFCFAEWAAWRLLWSPGICYTRDEFIALRLKLFGKKVVWETHMGQDNLVVRLLFLMRVPIVAISEGLKDFYVARGARPDNITAIPDAVDLAHFDIPVTKSAARTELGLPEAAKLFVYTGSRYAWKGVEILEAAKSFLPEDTKILIVSGRPHREIPLYLKAADALVLPNSAKEPISKHFTSPMKLFEYMASGRPIVASDLPALREVLDESTTRFFEPDNSESLAEALKDVCENQEAAKERAKKARELVTQYSWEKRARQIMNFIR